MVLGALADELDGVLSEGAERVRNPDWATTGPRESILLGLEGLPDDTLVVITPVDVPPVGRPLLCRLVERTDAPAAVGHEGRPGHPVLVRAGATRAALSAGGTLRDALGEGATVVEGGAAAVRDLDTPEDWASWAGTPPGRVLPGFGGVDHVCPRCGRAVSKAELADLFCQVLPSAEASRLARRFHLDADTLPLRWACQGCVDAGRAGFADLSAQSYRCGPRLLIYVDQDLRCSTCSRHFVHKAAEQRAFYEEYGFWLVDGPADPHDCGACRAQKRASARAQERLEALRRSTTADALDPVVLRALAEALRAAGSRRKALETLRQAKNRCSDETSRAALEARARAWAAEDAG